MDNLRRIDEPDKPSLSVKEVIALQRQVRTVKQIVWTVGLISICALLALGALNFQLFLLMQVYSHKIDTTSGKIHALQRTAAQERKDSAASSGDSKILSAKVEAMSSQIEDFGLKVAELKTLDESLAKVEASMLTIEKTSSANAEATRQLIADEKALFQRVDLLKNEVDILKYTDQARSLE